VQGPRLARRKASALEALMGEIAFAPESPRARQSWAGAENGRPNLAIAQPLWDRHFGDPSRERERTPRAAAGAL